jgi:hypothetical protein
MMKEAGPSITITSLTNALAFITGVFTPTPAIQIFCIYSTAGCIIDFFFQITFVAAAIACQEYWSDWVAAIAEKCPIFKIFVSKETPSTTKQQPEVQENNVPPKIKQSIASQMKMTEGHYEETVSSFIAGYCRILAMWPVRIAIYGIVVLYWASAVYGCTFMQLKMDSSNLISMEWIYDTFTWREGSLVYIFINNPPDLSKVANQDRLLGMVDRFETLKYSMGKNSTSIWLRPFLNHAIFYEPENTTSFNQ